MIIVLTPIKNEEWILEQFLTACSEFADSIIIADQQSTDNSRYICSKFNKVCLIENTSKNYSEAERQNLLINASRKLFPSEKRILFCLDADEIIIANSPAFQNGWDKIQSAELGSCVYFEKPDLLPSLNECVRWKDNYFPIGYIDDGSEHLPTEIHSTRIPCYPNSKKIYIDEIKFLHFAHTRPNVQSSKFRYYSAIENIKNITPCYLRRFAYQSFYQESRNTPNRNIETTPAQWLEKYNKMNLNLKSLPDPIYSWHDFEVLKLFEKYGYKAFKWDNFWDFDWEDCRLYALKTGIKDIPISVVKKPSRFVILIGFLIDFFYSIYRYRTQLFRFKRVPSYHSG